MNGVACGSEDRGSTAIDAGTAGTDASADGGTALFVLEGTWRRAVSSSPALDGMVVEVSDDGTRAEIISTPDNPFMFQAGDIKWRNIDRQSNRVFAFEDLIRETTSGAMSYVAGFIEAEEGNDDEVQMTFPTTGTQQRWERQ